VAVQRLPVREGKKDCEFFVKTGRCGFGMKCKFNHPVEKMLLLKAVASNSEGLPIRPGSETCPYFLRTSYCKFGWMCKYSHPQEIVDQRIAKSKARFPPESPSSSSALFRQSPPPFSVQFMPSTVASVAAPVAVPVVPVISPSVVTPSSLVYYVDGVGWIEFKYGQ